MWDNGNCWLICIVYLCFLFQTSLRLVVQGACPRGLLRDWEYSELSDGMSVHDPKNKLVCLAKKENTLEICYVLFLISMSWIWLPRILNAIWFCWLKDWYYPVKHVYISESETMKLCAYQLLSTCLFLYRRRFFPFFLLLFIFIFLQVTEHNMNFHLVEKSYACCFICGCPFVWLIDRHNNIFYH